MIVRMCLLPDAEVLHSQLPNQWLSYQMVYLVSQSSAMGIVELWLLPISKEHSLQYISKYPCSSISNSIGS